MEAFIAEISDSGKGVITESSISIVVVGSFALAEICPRTNVMMLRHNRRERKSFCITNNCVRNIQLGNCVQVSNLVKVKKILMFAVGACLSAVYGREDGHPKNITCKPSSVIINLARRWM